jgi:hypothetical protein
LPKKPQTAKPFCELLWGYLSLLAVVVTWIAQSEVCQLVQVGGYNVSLDQGPVPLSVEIMGNTFVLAASVGYAVYQLIFDKTMARIGTDNIWTINVFVAVMGVLNVVLIWPVLFLVSIPALPTAIREVPQIPSWATLTALTINASLALAFNISFAVATVKMGPFLTSVATVLTIPMTMVVDAVLHGDHFGIDACVGSVLVLTGFVGLVATS